MLNFSCDKLENMRIEIDQSGKVENISVSTVVGDSLGNFFAIRSIDKIRLQSLYRQTGRPKMFVREVFSLMVALTIQSSYTSFHTYNVDIEYPGKSDEIKNLILMFSKRLGCKINTDQIHFALIGKKSIAHKTVHDRFIGVTKGQLLKKNNSHTYFFPTKKGSSFVE